MTTSVAHPKHSCSQNGALDSPSKLVDTDHLIHSVSEMHLSDGDGTDEDKNSKGGYVFDKPEHKAALILQRQQLWAWIKREGTNLFDLTRISLPVCLFEPRSFLERMTTNWDYLDLLMAAGAATKPADRMRFVVAFAVSGMCRQVSFHKPFNPILGETYQSKYSNGVEVFCEQISHHPPISSWQVAHPDGKFVFYGNGNWSAGIKGNSVKGRQQGINCVQFPDGSKITYELVGITVKGVLWGQRTIKYGGEMMFRDEKNDLSCEVQIDPQPQQTLFQAWFKGKKACGYQPDQVKGTLKQGENVLDHVSGNWLHHVEWEKGVGSSTLGSKTRLWDIRSSQLATPVPVQEPLPSDCRHREDLIHLKADDHGASQEWKHKLEEKQRKDRRLRKEGGGYDEH